MWFHPATQRNIAQLKEDGLWEDTIVIVWADHGVGMPRGKHTVWEQGTHVPLIVRYPKKYQHLAPFDEAPSSAEATAGKPLGSRKQSSLMPLPPSPQPDVRYGQSGSDEGEVDE